MSDNLTRLDRILRMIVSVMLLIYGYLSGNLFALLLGLILLVTGLVSWCPIVWVANRIMLKSNHK